MLERCTEISNALLFYFFPPTLNLQIGRNWNALIGRRRVTPFQGFLKAVQTSCRISIPGNSSRREEKVALNSLRQKKLVPDAEPPSHRDVELLYQFFDQRSLSDISHLTYVVFVVISYTAYEVICNYFPDLQ